MMKQNKMLRILFFTLNCSQEVVVSH